MQFAVDDIPTMGFTHHIEGNEPTKKPKEYDEQQAINPPRSLRRSLRYVSG